MRRYIFGGGTAVVTGAASGIGEALAHGLAQRGSHLVLLDRDAKRLSDVAAVIQGANPGLEVETHVVDLADRDATTHGAHAVLRQHPQIRLLVNNAGVALGGRFDQVTLEEFDWVIDINFRATVRLTHILLPALKAEPGSHLVNVSSLLGSSHPPAKPPTPPTSSLSADSPRRCVRSWLTTALASRPSILAAFVPASPSQRVSVAACHARRRKTAVHSSPPC